jgi:hypothetical protein
MMNELNRKQIEDVRRVLRPRWSASAGADPRFHGIGPRFSENRTPVGR